MTFIAPRKDFKFSYLQFRFEQAYDYFFPLDAEKRPVPGVMSKRNLFDRLNDNYIGLHGARHYHDWTHIHTMLDVLDFIVNETGGRLSNKDVQTLILAIFFHDVVMDFESPHDNEERSVEWMENSISAGNPLADRLKHMILATKHKVNNENDFLTQIFLDIDLWALGDPDPDRFYDTTARIRAEYRHLDDGVFLRGRIQFLTAMQERGPLFYNPMGLNCLLEMEPNAMTNIIGECVRFQSIISEMDYLNRYMK